MIKVDKILNVSHLKIFFGTELSMLRINYCLIRNGELSLYKIILRPLTLWGCVYTSPTHFLCAELKGYRTPYAQFLILLLIY